MHDAQLTFAGDEAGADRPGHDPVRPDPASGSPVPRDPALVQLEANYKVLRGAMLGLGAFVLSYGAVALGFWIQDSWLPSGYRFESDLPSFALFEFGVVGVALTAAVMLFRRRAELDEARADEVPAAEAPPSPLGRAERHSHLLRSLSRQVDSLLLWLPLAILMTVLSGLFLLASTALVGGDSNPATRIAALALVTLGVPVGVTVFGVGSFGAIRSTTRRQHQLSEGGRAWLDPSLDYRPAEAERPQPSSEMTPRALSPPPRAGSSIVSEVRARGRRERRVVLWTALGGLLALSALAGLILGELECESLGAGCDSGTDVSLVAGIVVGIVALGFLAPAYVGIMAVRRRHGPAAASGPGRGLGRPTGRLSDEIAVVAQVETYQNRLREDARDSLWLTWFTAIWVVAAATFAMPLVGVLAYPFGLAGLGAEAPGVVGIMIGQGLLVLLPVPIAALATMTWLERRNGDATSSRAYRALLRGYALLEQGFWERF